MKAHSILIRTFALFLMVCVPTLGKPLFDGLYSSFNEKQVMGNYPASNLKPFFDAQKVDISAQANQSATVNFNSNAPCGVVRGSYITPEGKLTTMDNFSTPFSIQAAHKTEVEFIYQPSIVCGGVTYKLTNTDPISPIKIQNPNKSISVQGYYQRVTPVDKTPPIVSYTIDGVKGNNDWYISDVNISWTVTDLESPFLIKSGCDPITLSSDTLIKSITCTAISEGGTTKETANVSIDKTSPVITFSGRSPLPNSYGWNNGTVTVTWVCSDALSGALSSSISSVKSNQGAGQSAAGICQDQAGNRKSSAPVSDINIDLTEPSIEFVGTSYLSNGKVLVTWRCMDALSGVVSGEFTSEVAVNQEARGVCRDLAGNEREAFYTPPPRPTETPIPTEPPFKPIPTKTLVSTPTYTPQPRVNHPPVSDDLSVTTFEDEPISFTLIVRDPDERDTFTYTILENPAHGDITGMAPNLTYSPLSGYHGEDSFTYEVCDNGIDMECDPETTVTINVLPKFQEPTLVRKPRLLIFEDSGHQEEPAFVKNIPPNQQVIFELISIDKPSLFSVIPAIDPNGTLTYTPAPDQNGVTTILFVMQYIGEQMKPDEQGVYITIYPVNDAPSFKPGGDISLGNSGQPYSTSWATEITEGPTDEEGQEITFLITNSNPSIFSRQPEIDKDGLLTFTLEEDFRGSVTVLVQLSDNGGTANGGLDTSTPVAFTITAKAPLKFYAIWVFGILFLAVAVYGIIRLIIWYRSKKEKVRT